MLRISCAAGFLLAPMIAAAQSFAGDSTPCSARLGTREQRPATSDSMRRRVASDTSARAAVVLFAAASAREVTFAKQPEIRVRLCGGLDSLHVVERRNLPNPVVSGRTYRDVYVAVEIFGRLNAECIVAALNQGAAPGAASARPDSAGQRNACASLEVSGTRTKPPESR